MTPARSSKGQHAEDHSSDHEDDSKAKHGLVSMKEYSFDFNNDGVADELAKSTYTYDKKDNLVASTFEDDYGRRRRHRRPIHALCLL